MKTLLLLALTIAFVPLQTHGHLWDFQKMIRFATGKDAVYNYGFYGCYCGYGGQGSPKDSTDWCCAAHDCCYNYLEEIKCGTKWLKYNVTYQNGQIFCEWQDYCRWRLCECDKTAATCFARTLNSYNEQYRFHYYNKHCLGRDYWCLWSRPLEV